MCQEIVFRPKPVPRTLQSWEVQLIRSLLLPSCKRVICRKRERSSRVVLVVALRKKYRKPKGSMPDGNIKLVTCADKNASKITKM